MKPKNTILKASRHSFFDHKVASSHFSQTNLNLNRLEDFALLFKKAISSPSIKNLEKTEKSHFQMPGTFVFEFKVASK